MTPKIIRIVINDKNYTSWHYQDVYTNAEIETEIKINPIEEKLFSMDLIECTESEVKIKHSPIRTTETIAGILQLETNKTYGRTENKKRLLYKCIPNDKYLPAFLVPYEPKIGFTKVQKNKYVIFKFSKWTNKHPEGVLVETIGDVDKLEAFYEYQLYRKSLHVSIADITNKTRVAFKEKSPQTYIEQIKENPQFAIQDRTTDTIFTIDPNNSTDFDDGFSVKCIDDKRKKYTVSVYIANVYVWLETLGLWNSFSQRVATIYLPDYRRPMLPTLLSDALCSLQEGEDRFAFVMDVPIENGIVDESNIQFSNAHIRVSKNYRYEEHRLISDPHYQMLVEATCPNTETSINSHDIVGQWMIRMNTYCARKLKDQECGIFRSVVFTEEPTPSSEIKHISSEDTRRVISQWNNTTGQYSQYSKNERLKHDMMQLDTYIHITSPIRRLVDLLNYMYFQRDILGQSISQPATEFMTMWIGKLDYINASMRSIRKVQNDCELLCKCINDPTIMERSHEGVLFDRMVKRDGTVSYMVYLEKVKLLSRVTMNSCDVPNYTGAKFRIYVFEEEDKAHKKLRVQYEPPI